MSVPAVNLRPSATDAYRQDVGSREWEPPTPYLARSIEIATVLDAATAVEDNPDRDMLLIHATHLALELLAPETSIDCWHDFSDANAPTTSLRALVQQLRLRGHPRLSAHILDSVGVLFPPHSMEGLRILHARAAGAWGDGDEVLLKERAGKMFALARGIGTDEALFHAWTILETTPFQRGNLPAFAKAAARSLKYAIRSKNPRAMSSAYNSISIVHGSRGEFGKAIIANWQAISLSDHPLQLMLILGNTAETLHRAGCYAAARSARAVVLSRKLEIGPNQLFVNLGGYAESCAALGDTSGVRWAAGQTLKLLPAQRQARGIAQGLFGCANACARLGLTNLARPLRAEGMAIADAKGYHDLRLMPEPSVGEAVAPLDAAADAARQSIEDLAPEGVSMTLELVAR